MDVREVVFTEGWPAVLLVVVVVGSGLVVLGLALVCAAVELIVIVVGCSDGEAPVACCKSLPCSAMSAGPS